MLDKCWITIVISYLLDLSFSIYKIGLESISVGPTRRQKPHSYLNRASYKVAFGYYDKRITKDIRGNFVVSKD